MTFQRLQDLKKSNSVIKSLEKNEKYLVISIIAPF